MATSASSGYTRNGVQLPVDTECTYISRVGVPGQLSVARLDRSGASPLWQQVLTNLRQRLANDEFANAFPGELALVQQYGVSRHTVPRRCATCVPRAP